MVANTMIDIQIQLIHVDRFSSFHWKIPYFPVLPLEFVKDKYRDLRWCDKKKLITQH